MELGREEADECPGALGLFIPFLSMGAEITVVHVSLCSNIFCIHRSSRPAVIRVLVDSSVSTL